MIPENEVEDFWNTLVPTDESQEKKQFPRYRLLWEAMRSGNWEVCNLVSRYRTKTVRGITEHRLYTQHGDFVPVPMK